jgi:zinc protease
MWSGSTPPCQRAASREPAAILAPSAAIAEALAEFIGLTRSPDTIEKLYATYQAVTPADVRAAAGRYLVDQNRTIVTLATETDAKGGAK